MNVSALNEFKEQLNSQASLREYLIGLLPVESVAELTRVTNELTGVTLVSVRRSRFRSEETTE